MSHVSPPGPGQQPAESLPGISLFHTPDRSWCLCGWDGMLKEVWRWVKHDIAETETPS